MPWAIDTPAWEHASNYTGSTPRVVAMDDPQKVVDAIIRVSLYPGEKHPVGWKAQEASFIYCLFPGLTKRISSEIVH
jgi:hypothetical protein